MASSYGLVKVKSAAITASGSARRGSRNASKQARTAASTLPDFERLSFMVRLSSDTDQEECRVGGDVPANETLRAYFCFRCFCRPVAIDTPISAMPSHLIVVTIGPASMS